MAIVRSSLLSFSARRASMLEFLAICGHEVRAITDPVHEIFRVQCPTGID